MAENAARVDWAGLGVRLPRRYATPRGVRHAVRRALGRPGLRERARRRARAGSAAHDAGGAGAPQHDSNAWSQRGAARARNSVNAVVPPSPPSSSPPRWAARAVVVGGLAGFLLGFVGALLGIDRALGFAGVSRIEAERAYRRLARRRPGRSPTCPTTSAGRRSAPRRRARRADDRDRLDRRHAPTATRPRASTPPSARREWSRERWTQLWLAAHGGGALPPISVYRVGDDALRPRRPPPCVRRPRARRRPASTRASSS